MASDVHELISESVASIVCSEFGLKLWLFAADYVELWIDEPAAFRIGMAVIHEAAAGLIDAVAPALSASVPLEIAS